MKKFMIIAILPFIILVFICTGTNEQQKPKEKELLTFLENLKSQDIDIKLTGIGRYQVFQHSQFVKNTFLLDTLKGRFWIIVEDTKTKKLWWQELNVENRDTFSTEELFKNDK